MIQVWLYDENRVFTESTFVDELGENMTATPLLVGYIKPTLNEQEEWFEGATQEEIKEWEEANKPLPQEPNEMEILAGQVKSLQNENKLLNAQVNALNMTTDFHEECLAEMAMIVYA